MRERYDGRRSDLSARLPFSESGKASGKRLTGDQHDHRCGSIAASSGDVDWVQVDPVVQGRHKRIGMKDVDSERSGALHDDVHPIDPARLGPREADGDRKSCQRQRGATNQSQLLLYGFVGGPR